MTNLIWKTLLASPAVGAAMAFSGSAIAAEPVGAGIVESAVGTAESASIEIFSDIVVAEPIELAQVTSVSELSDV